MAPQRFVLMLLLLAASACPVMLSAGDDSPPDISAFLARHCLNCHNAEDHKGGLDLTRSQGALKGGDSGPALVPGKPDESLVWERVSQDEMPPKRPLSAADKETLRAWLAGGAKWDQDPIDRLQYTTDNRAGFDWWSLQPVRRPDPPAVKQNDWPVNPVDRFVLARLEDRGLTPSAAADRRTLIRRLTFDLTGLPPRPEDVEAFVANGSEDAYIQLVDRLLASSEFGERWGRHWLDVVRFGESQGFERDRLRTNAWQYRDWVISAFNADLPYDEFVRLQVAGDLFEPHNPKAVIATGFLVCAPYDEVGQSQQSAAMKAVVRQDELEDIVGVTGQTFLALTVNCARCHDHKFDPIRQREYYSLCASLAGVRHGERESLSILGKIKQLRRVTELQAEVDSLSKKLAAIDEPVRERLRANAATPVTKKPEPIARWEFEGNLKDAVGELHGKAHGKARAEGGRLILDGSSYLETPPLAKDLAEKTLEVWLTLTRLDQQGGGAISVQALDGGVFDAIVFGERDAGQWMAGSNGFVRTSSFQAPVETEVNSVPVQVAIVYGSDRSITCYRNGKPYGQPYLAESLAMFAAGKSQVLFGLRHAPPGGNRFLTGAIDRAALYDRALTANEVAALAGVVSDTLGEDEILAALPPTEREVRQSLAYQRSQAQTELRLLSGGTVYAVSPKPPEATHVLARGDTRLVGDVAPSGGIASLRGLSNFQLPPDADDGSRRIQLARWLTDPNNPLTARVIVNRLWQYHFGAGLVETPNDFGFNGGRPSHPELLDWLADELVHPQTFVGETERVTPPKPWSLKHIHRLIVTSAAYRQASISRPEAERVDAGNRLLWRHTPLRLEAEAVRDAMLDVAGELNRTMGGPGFRDFRTFTFNSQFYEMLDPVGHEFARRTVYRTWVRSGRSDFLDVFDCPDPSATAPKRAVTTTPLQALSLLNNSFVLRMSQKFAGRVQREAGSEADRQVARAYALAFGRSPGDEETTLGREFISQHGLPAYCRVLLNSNEFLYVD